MSDTRTFPDVLNEWTNRVIELNAKAKETETLAILFEVGLLGQQLITEANSIGMMDVERMVTKRLIKETEECEQIQTSDFSSVN